MSMHILFILKYHFKVNKFKKSSCVPYLLTIFCLEKLFLKMKEPLKNCDTIKANYKQMLTVQQNKYVLQYG